MLETPQRTKGEDEISDTDLGKTSDKRSALKHSLIITVLLFFSIPAVVSLGGLIFFSMAGIVSSSMSISDALYYYGNDFLPGVIGAVSFISIGCIYLFWLGGGCFLFPFASLITLLLLIEAIVFCTLLFIKKKFPKTDEQKLFLKTVKISLILITTTAVAHGFFQYAYTSMVRASEEDVFAKEFVFTESIPNNPSSQRYIYTQYIRESGRYNQRIVISNIDGTEMRVVKEGRFSFPSPSGTYAIREGGEVLDERGTVITLDGGNYEFEIPYRVKFYDTNEFKWSYDEQLLAHVTEEYYGDTVLHVYSVPAAKEIFSVTLGKKREADRSVAWNEDINTLFFNCEQRICFIDFSNRENKSEYEVQPLPSSYQCKGVTVVKELLYCAMERDKVAVTKSGSTTKFLDVSSSRFLGIFTSSRNKIIVTQNPREPGSLSIVSEIPFGSVASIESVDGSHIFLNANSSIDWERRLIAYEFVFMDVNTGKIQDPLAKVEARESNNIFIRLRSETNKGEMPIRYKGS